jgi:tRNA(fMet)-specific endonuclease VapC
MILYDSSFLIDLFQGVPGLADILDEDDGAVSVISYHEIMAGVKKTKAKREERFFKTFFDRVDILLFDLAGAEESSSLAAKLSALGTPINTVDVMIAGSAISHGVEIIITRDVDFLQIGKISDLCIKMYTTEAR